MLKRALPFSFSNYRPYQHHLSFLRHSARNFSDGPNDHLLDMLRKHMDREHAQESRNKFKIKAFSSAIAAISQVEEPITSGEQAKQIRGVGAGIAERIDNFLNGAEDLLEDDTPETLHLRREETIKRHARTALQSIPGLGSVSARRLVDQGCLSITQLTDPDQPYFAKLTASQKIGARFHQHLAEKVARQEAEAVLKFIKESLSSQFQLTLVGSYRRNQPTSSDIDILILHPDYVHIPTPTLPNPFAPSSSEEIADVAEIKPKTKLPTPLKSSSSSSAERAASPLLNTIIPTLTTRGFIAATLSSGPRKWQGIVRLPSHEPETSATRKAKIERGEGSFRRLDLNLVPVKSEAAALLALTGDTAFNRDMRRRAGKMGLILNEYGVWRWKENGAEEKGDPSQEMKDAVVGQVQNLGLEEEQDPPKRKRGRPRKSPLPQPPAAPSGQLRKSAPSPHTPESKALNGGGFWELVKFPHNTEAEILDLVGMEYVCKG